MVRPAPLYLRESFVLTVSLYIFYCFLPPLWNGQSLSIQQSTGKHVLSSEAPDASHCLLSATGQFTQTCGRGRHLMSTSAGSLASTWSTSRAAGVSSSQPSENLLSSHLKSSFPCRAASHNKHWHGLDSISDGGTHPYTQTVPKQDEPSSSLSSLPFLKNWGVLVLSIMNPNNISSNY